MSVGRGDKRVVLKFGILKASILQAGSFRNFERIEPPAVIDEAQLAKDAEAFPVDMGGDSQTIEAMNVSDNIIDGQVGCSDEQLVVESFDFAMLVDNGLNTEALLVIFTG